MKGDDLGEGGKVGPGRAREEERKGKEGKRKGEGDKVWAKPAGPRGFILAPETRRKKWRGRRSGLDWPKGRGKGKKTYWACMGHGARPILLLLFSINCLL